MRSPLKKYSSGFFNSSHLIDRPIGVIIAVFHLRDIVSDRFVVRTTNRFCDGNRSGTISRTDSQLPIFAQ